MCLRRSPEKTARGFGISRCTGRCRRGRDRRRRTKWQRGWRMTGGGEKTEWGVSEQTTTLLALLLICGVLLAAFSAVRLSRAREAAADAQGALMTCRAE